MSEPDGATPIDPDERAGLKFDHVTTRDQLNELEQENIQQGLKWLQGRKDELSEAFVRQLHERMLGEVWDWAGCYRLTEKNLGVEPSHIPVEVRKLIDDAVCWAEHATYQPLEGAARFHHRLVQIHPFANGNGRHARLAADFYLERYFDFPAIEWANGFDLDATNRRREQYIAALRAADERDFAPLFEFVGLS